MNPRLVAFLVVVVVLILIRVYGKTYLWTYRAARWADAEPRSDLRMLTRGERVALGEPVRSLLITAFGLVAAFGAIALFRSQDPQLAVLGLVCGGGVAASVLLFVLRHRLPTWARVGTLRGELTLPLADTRYVPRGAYLVGGAPVLYPLHWERFIAADVGKEVDVALTRHGAVVRHGGTLSLDDEARSAGNTPWESTAAATTGLVALLVAALLFYGPLGAQIDAASRALQGHRLIVVDSEQAWREWTPHVGDEVRLSGVQGDCALASAVSMTLSSDVLSRGTASRPSGHSRGQALDSTGVYRCNDVYLGAPDGVDAAANSIPAQDEAAIEPVAQDETVQKSASALSLAMENMLASRRNATADEVRAYWRQAGMGSSQRYTLSAPTAVLGMIDQLCRTGACPVRDILLAAQGAPANRYIDSQGGDIRSREARRAASAASGATSSSSIAKETIVLDTADATRLAQAAFALAEGVLAPAHAQALAHATTRRQSAQWMVQSLTGAPLGAVKTKASVADGASNVASLPADSPSPRVQWLRTQRALQTEGTHVMAFEGGVVEVDAGAVPPRAVVDTRIMPSALWVMLAPIAALGILGGLTACAIVATWYQRRRQQRQLAMISERYEQRLDTP